MPMQIDPSKLLINMEKLRAKMAKDGQRRAVVAGARVVGVAMVEAAPILDRTTARSTALDPGELKRSVRVRTRQEDGQTVAMVGPWAKEKGGNLGKIAYNVEYGHRLVKGGKSRLGPDGKFRGAGKVIGNVAAHPFLRPAFEASAEAAIEAVGASLGESLKEAARG